jgi:hypothetical protein
MENDYIIEALQDEIRQLRIKVAIQTLDQDLNETEAEKLFREQQEEIQLLHVRIEALTKSRDAFQLENARLKKRVIMLEKTLKVRS